MRILIIPGWLHSEDMYDNLVKELDAQIYRYSGDTIKNRVKALKRYLQRTNYDYVIGFCMGGNIAMKSVTKEKLILVNPIYGGLKDICKKFDAEAMNMTRNSPMLAKLMSMFLVSGFGHKAEPLIRNLNKCNAAVELQLLKELEEDDYVAKPREAFTALILSKKDKILVDEKIDELKKDINAEAVTEVKGGHTSLLECPAQLLSAIKELMKAGGN